MNAARHPILLTASALFVFSVVGATLLSGTFGLTHTRIEQSEREAKMRLIAQTLPPGGFDNDLIKDALPLPADPRLGLKRPGLAYPAYRHGQPVAVVLEAGAPDGYSGEIRFLLGIRPDGTIVGVRVTGHRETPGLGDYIEIGKSAWIHEFDGKSLDNPQPHEWKVKKDGGRFEYMAGATITPRALVKAVRNALTYFQAHRDQLLRPAPASEAPHVR